MRKFNILIVEDICSMINLYEHCLEDKFNIYASKNFDEIKNTKNKEDIDVVVMDFHIPGESFDNILSYVKEKFPKSKRIIVSGHAKSFELKDTYKEDVFEVFEKPLNDYNAFTDYLLNIISNNTKEAEKQLKILVKEQKNTLLETEERLKQLPPLEITQKSFFDKMKSWFHKEKQ